MVWNNEVDDVLKISTYWMTINCPRRNIDAVLSIYRYEQQLDAAKQRRGGWLTIADVRRRIVSWSALRDKRHDTDL